MKQKAIKSTVLPDIQFNSHYDWLRWLIIQQQLKYKKNGLRQMETRNA